MRNKLYDKPNAEVSAIVTGDVILESGEYIDMPDDEFFSALPTGEP